MVIDFDSQILIPKGDVGDFAAIACDQFSSQPEYWNNLKTELKAQSALDLILPECFLDEAEERLPLIREMSEDMLIGGRFTAVKGTVAVTRTTPYGRVRHGLVAAINLDDYEYTAGNTALIRASERTIQERIPPRVAIREAIDIELPHILLLVDDRKNAIKKAVDAAQKTPLYDGDLKGGGGHITGELIAPRDTAPLKKAVFDIIAESEKKFGTKLFALVGDGNHSLATAKHCRDTSPNPYNGYALVELVNIYDDGLVCEPIHRLVKTDDPALFLDGLRLAVNGTAVTTAHANGTVSINVPEDKIQAIKEVDNYCEAYVELFGGSVEYVHGDDALVREGCVGIKMRGVEKFELFNYVVKNGTLPKKTFSLGEAEEKRYYIEARIIRE
ncbi:MAG: DUF1015 family protein [Clostridiales bacterium]|nr:DUF1015 family protein [Clostridiales bacterium]